MAKRSFYSVLAIGIIAIALVSLYRFGLLKITGTKSTSITSTLQEVIDISDLSTAEFVYRGIADVYTEGKKPKLKCRVCYNAKVKAGIDMKKVKFISDPESKEILATLPPIEIKVILIEEESMATLPSDSKIGIDVMLKCSQEDAEDEAKKTGGLMTAAKDNLKKTIEGLSYPILKSQGYKLKWK